MVSGDVHDPADFARRAAAKPPGLMRNVWGLLRRHRKWWLAPIVIVLLAVGALLILSATPLGPFLYPLF
jgi:hypothetical protein